MNKLVLSIIMALALFTSRAQTVSTLAGSGTAGYNSTAITASDQALFNHPRGIAVDTNDNIWIAEYDNHRIRFIGGDHLYVYHRSGFLSIPSSGIGYSNQVGSAAKYRNPSGLAIGADNSIYIVEEGNHCVRKLSPFVNVGNGQAVSHVAGGDDPTKSGNVDATGTNARFDQPYDIAIDKNGNMYVSDVNNNSIRKVTSAGVVTTFAGSTTAASGYADGQGTAALFFIPRGLCIDNNGDLLVADFGNARVRRVNIATSPAGKVSTVAGNGNTSVKDGAVASAEFRGPNDVVVDANGYIYVSEAFNGHVIRRIASGQVSTIAGAAADNDFINGAGATARFDNPSGLAVDKLKKTLYIADYDNHAIRMIDFAGLVDFMANNTSPIVGANVHFTNWTAVRNGTTFKWIISGTEGVDFNLNGGTLTDSSISVAFLKAGTYDVVLEAYNSTWGKKTTAKMGYINAKLGIKEFDNAALVHIYPNPSADGNITINNGDGEFGIRYINVTDMNGRIVYTDRNNPNFRNRNISVGLGQLKQGVYFVTLGNDVQVMTKKLVIQ